MIATMMHKEYGWRSPWFSIGAYSAATATAVGRIMNDKHWTGDVIAGAVIGIAATQLGYLISEKIFKDRYLSGGSGRSPDNSQSRDLRKDRSRITSVRQ